MIELYHSGKFSICTHFLSGFLDLNNNALYFLSFILFYLFSSSFLLLCYTKLNSKRIFAYWCLNSLHKYLPICSFSFRLCLWVMCAMHYQLRLVRDPRGYESSSLVGWTTRASPWEGLPAFVVHLPVPWFSQVINDIVDFRKSHMYQLLGRYLLCDWLMHQFNWLILTCLCRKLSHY